MQTIKTGYDNEGILNESFREFDGQIEIKYVKKSPDFEKGVLVGLARFTHPDSCINKLDELVRSEDWYFDIELKNIKTDKKYPVNFEFLWEYGVIFAVDNIIEFVSGLASCPRTIEKIVGDESCWKHIKYLDPKTLHFDSKKMNDFEYFTLSVDSLNIKPIPIKINIF